VASPFREYPRIRRSDRATRCWIRVSLNTYFELMSEGFEWRAVVPFTAAIVFVPIAEFYPWKIDPAAYPLAGLVAKHLDISDERLYEIARTIHSLCALSVLSLLVTVGEKRGLDSIGLSIPSVGTFAVALSACTFYFAGWPAMLRLLIAIAGTLGRFATTLVPQTPSKPSISSNGTSNALFGLLALNAADVIYEEFIRAYVIERIVGFTGSIWLASTVAVALFVVLHLPGRDGFEVLTVIPLILLLTTLYALRRDIVACMLCHFLINAVFPVLDAYGVSWLRSEMMNGGLWLLLIIELLLYQAYLTEKSFPRVSARA
jgi:membrane protease YdiL (CAAX protease family)